MSAGEAQTSVVPANEASWEDLQTVFGTRGQASRCQCQRYKLGPRESFASFPAEERADRLRQQTDCGYRESDATSGLVAYLNSEPAGWCAVEPRTAYAGLLRVYRVPWEGRSEDETDDRRHPGGAPRRYPRHLRRRGLHRGQQTHTPPCRDEDRLSIGARTGLGPVSVAVCLATVPDIDDEHQQQLLLDGVDDPVVTSAHPPNPRPVIAAEHLRRRRSRFIG